MRRTGGVPLAGAVALLAALCCIALVSRSVGAAPIISLAPAAELVNGIDDILPTGGNCTSAIERYCNGTSPGGAALAECLGDLINAAAFPDDDAAGETVAISPECTEEVLQFRIQRSANINANPQLAKACKDDVYKYCNVSQFYGYRPGQITACLRDVKDKLKSKCQDEVFKSERNAAMDYRADPDLRAACEEDAAKMCADTPHGLGRVQECLRGQRMKLSWMCEEQLFRQEVEDADDIRLSARLFQNCLDDKRKFCKDVPPGNSRVKDCLEENREEDGFSEDCKAEIDLMIEARVKDFRLDFRLRRDCEDDIFNMCAFGGELDDLEDEDGESVVRCLQDYVNEVRSDKCRAQVRKYQELASEDIRFDVPLADACYDDRQTLCGSVPAGSARVIRCLTGQRDKLSPLCRAVMFDEEVRFSENIDFQTPMRGACQSELQRFCKDVPHGSARAIRCLQDNKDQDEFGGDCKKEVLSFEEEASQDYRLNYRLYEACLKDKTRLCEDSCNAGEGQLCAGTVLRCLTDHKDEILDESCSNEVLYFEKMEVEDFNNDVILAAACRSDVDKFCKKAADSSAVHRCLRDHRANLSEPCRKEELLLEEEQAESVDLRPNLLRACSSERKSFCAAVDPAEGRVFRCLAENMNDPDFGDECRAQLLDKLYRRQANWKLDPPLRRECKADVAKLCSAEDAKDAEDAEVYHCLVRNMDDITKGCLTEVRRAVHMAFYAWTQGAPLTSPCDTDVQHACLGLRPNMALTPGEVGRCLAQQVAQLEDLEDSTAGSGSGGGNHRRLLQDLESLDEGLPGTGAKPKPSTAKKATPASDDDEDAPHRVPAAPPAWTLEKFSPTCRALVLVGEAPDPHMAFDAAMAAVTLMKQQLQALEDKTGVQMVDPRATGGVTLSGWLALSGMISFCVVLLAGAWLAWRHFRPGGEKGYTLVYKQDHTAAPTPSAAS